MNHLFCKDIKKKYMGVIIVIGSKYIFIVLYTRLHNQALVLFVNGYTCIAMQSMSVSIFGNVITISYNNAFKPIRTFCSEKEVCFETSYKKYHF